MDFSLASLQLLIARIQLFFKRLQFSNKMQLAFLEDLYLLINDGIPANRAIDMMSQVTTGISREVALSISDKIAQGQPLAEGMRQWFSINVVEIIRVGEAGGALAMTLKSARNMLSQKGLAIGSFISALSYPILVLVVGCIVIVYLNNSVFVQFKNIKPIAEWPASGQRLVEVARLIQDWWWIIVLSVIAIFIIFRITMTRYVGEFRSALDTIPPFTFYRDLTASRLLETLGLLISSGVVFKTAIRIMQYQANPYLLSHLIMMDHLLGMGKTNIADVLDTGLVSNQDLMRLRVMAEVKGFEHGLIRMGVRGSEQSTKTLRFISRLIGGFLLTIGAVLIMIIVQGVYLTGMSMAQP